MDERKPNPDNPDRGNSPSPKSPVDPEITNRGASPRLSPPKHYTNSPAHTRSPARESPTGARSPGRESPAPTRSPGRESPTPARTPAKESPPPERSPAKESPAPERSAAGTPTKQRGGESPKSATGGRGSPEGSKKESAERARSNKESPEKEKPEKPSKSSISGSVDALNTEFIYYSAVLRTYTPTLSREFDKVTAHLWMKKLFGPEYHSTILKPKRNKYLLYLTITIYNDETYGIFRQEPPCGVLPELKDIPVDKEFPPAEWEMEKQWEETICDLPDDMKFVDCYLHDGDCPQDENNINVVLDLQFQFYLWLARPYVALLADPENKTTVACWIQQLCGIAPGEDNCPEMKILRNEYMQVLLGYVHDLRVEGPFRRMPAAGAIPPLTMWYEHCEGDGRYNDPVEKEKEEFMASQPLPQTGAFAYINVTGEMFGNQI